MATTTLHVRKVSLGLRRKYRLSADDGGRPGRPLGYAEKELTVAQAVTLYSGDRHGPVLATVRESAAGWLEALTGYQVEGPDGDALGSFGVVWRRSLERTTWNLEQPGLGRLVGRERSVGTARLRRLVGGLDLLGDVVGGLIRYHFDFRFEGAPVADDPVFSVEKPKVLDDWYRVVARDERLDPTLLLALAVTMETRQRR